MTLDYFTLYITIVLASFALCAIWAAVAWQYRALAAARMWFAASVLTGAGGILLPFQHMSVLPVLAGAAGNGLIILGFWALWLGARSFQGQPGGKRVAGWTTAAFVLLIAVFFRREGYGALILAIGQSIPMLATIGVLAPRARRSSGAGIAIAGILIGLAAHAVVVVINMLILAGLSGIPGTAVITSYTMLGLVFGGLLWNFGFIVLTIEKLRKEVAELAYLDPLTGAWNRRKLDEWLEREDARSSRTGRPFAVLAFDLDHFKAVNDRLGHAGGDAALAHLVRIAKANLRETDLLARIGGDEFCVLMPEATAEQGHLMATRIAQALRESPLLCPGGPVHLSASIGVAGWSPGRACDYDAIFARADDALYAAKLAGRDQVVCAHRPFDTSHVLPGVAAKA